MQKRTKRLLAALLLLGPVVVIAVVFLVAPKAETPRDEALPAGDLSVVAEGPVQPGDADHPASGHVTLYWNGTGHLLRFDGYEARSGPNVWFFAVTDPDTRAEGAVEEEGLLVRVPGPGHATYRGTFNVPLPPEFDPATYGGIVAWDRTFDTAYARVTLTAPAAPPEDGSVGNGTRPGGAAAQHP